jgi:hypothetical protein
MPEWLLQAALTVVLSIVGFALTRAIRTIDNHSKELEEIRQDLLKNYVRHEHLLNFNSEMKAVRKLLTRIQINLAVLAEKMRVKLPPTTAEEDES